ncbi:hypothetical protein RHECNPAF_1330036 [Rhizobium etli CNPAF512]|nr:hypothetical protein RHECNPAF_1330036 [Rhizobium etli CNPAF512]
MLKQSVDKRSYLYQATSTILTAKPALGRR